MSVEEHDQWRCLQDDWSILYDFTRSDDENDPLPFKAAPHADPEALMEAASARLLREMVSQDHARRVAADVEEIQDAL